MAIETECIQGRLAGLRERMKECGIDFYLIVSEDFHGSEYVGAYFKCREYMSGFDGSAGTLLVTATEAGLWTDGRYFLQAEEQLHDTGITLWKSGEAGVPGLPEYLEQEMQSGQCLGYDGRTISISYASQLKKRLQAKQITFQENVDLMGKLWQDRPALPEESAWLLSEEYSGQSCAAKLRELREQMKKKKADIHLLASLDDIAWLYNMRGADIAYNPVVLAFSLVTQTEAVIYMASEKLDQKDRNVLAGDGIAIKPYEQIYQDLRQMGTGQRILLDPASVNVALQACIPKGSTVLCQPNPTKLAKAVKNETERKHMRQAHIQDGVAVTRLIYWLKQQSAEQLLEENVTERAVAQRLENYRQSWEDYQGPSFAPIIAVGEHGAIVHYEPTEETDAPVVRNTFVLMDTGGHYLQGTTDITRTVALGKVTREMQERYTAVLCGNLKLGNAYFKYGYSGTHLDYLAREPLWRLGLDFNHGTGHGVGYLLNVHEGPQGIRQKEAGGRIGTVLQEGMITSNEPGVYLPGEYGIRLENLILCLRDKQTTAGDFMHFETLTMAPFDREAILPECMSQEELQLLNEYHAVVYERIAPYLDAQEAAWLAEVTAPLTR